VHDIERGELALVLHTHMPYVEGYGTWPFGEEWLWEAIATSYLPLLDVLETGGPVTLSVTPVLADQLEALRDDPAIADRFLGFLRDVRADTHARDVEGLRAGGEDVLAAEVERAAGDYAQAVERFEALDGDLLGPLMARATWTSAATHAVLPLCATDAGVRLQVQTGIEAFRRRSGDWGGGFWLPECAHAPWLEPLLEEAGVHATCVDLTDVLGFGAPGHGVPLRSPAGPLLVPIDRVTLELAWSDHGYPAHGTYRDYHHHTNHHHRPWANDGSPYDHEAALALVCEHAAEFVARTRARLEACRERLGRPPLLVCALDTELLGHWWYEGAAWLQAVLGEAEAQGLAIAPLDEALERHPPDLAPPDLPPTTWGTPRTLHTWSGPQVADLAWAARDAELRVVGAGKAATEAAVRELLLAQSSDWTFMVTRELAAPYGRQRAEAHAGATVAALEHSGWSDEARPRLHSRAGRVRHVAPYCSPSTLLVP
jgi:1,4-alpha-glucan branching enzyme